MSNNRQKPSFIEEEKLIAQGYRLIAGIDEVGRGPLAGPVVAAAVILPCDLHGDWLAEVRDSKQLSPAKREFLSPRIQEAAISVGVGGAGHDVVDEWGILEATHIAMKMALRQLSVAPDYLLIDHVRLTEMSMPQKNITNGDSLCFSIACASILAKVARDYLMVEYDKEYPGYEFARHKGYCTKTHLALLHHWGPSPIHRRSFRPVKEIICQKNEA